MTPREIKALHKRITEGISHGLNATEISDCLDVPNSQLVRLIMELTINWEPKEDK